MDAETIYHHVESRYSASARSKLDPAYSTTVASAFGYSPEDLSSIPADSNLGLSCGNPLALAHLKPGETVVDLGSGAGFDCFLAAKRVGETGKVVGVDMNKDMLARARRNAEKSSTPNVSFVEAKITSIPLPSASVDVIISNCVINLVPAAEKPLVFREMYRLLKPGGRVAVSDILLKKELSEDLQNDMALYVGCVAGASQIFQYEQWLDEAGFGERTIIDAGSDLNVYIGAGEEPVESQCSENASCAEVGRTGTQCCGPAKTTSNSGCCGGEERDAGVVGDFKRLKNVDLNEWAGSFKIFAVKSAKK